MDVTTECVNQSMADRRYTIGSVFRNKKLLQQKEQTHGCQSFLCCKEVFVWPIPCIFPTGTPCFPIKPPIYSSFLPLLSSMFPVLIFLIFFLILSHTVYTSSIAARHMRDKLSGTKQRSPLCLSNSHNLIVWLSSLWDWLTPC